MADLDQPGAPLPGDKNSGVAKPLVAFLGPAASYTHQVI